MDKAKIGLTLLFLLALISCGNGNKIEPAFHATIKVLNGGQLALDGKTNLPDGTKVDVWIGLPGPGGKSLFSASSFDPREFDVVVQNGQFACWFPSPFEKGLKTGKYVVSIGLLPDQKTILGPKNERISGPGVTVEPNGQKGFVARREVVLPDMQPHEDVVFGSLNIPPRIVGPAAWAILERSASALRDKFPGLVKYSEQLDFVLVHPPHEIHAASGAWVQVVTLELQVMSNGDLPAYLVQCRGHHILVDIGVDGKTLAVNKQAAVSLLLDKPFDDVPKFLDIPL